MKKVLFIIFVFIPFTVIGEVIVPMEKQENGLFLIPCKVNEVPMKFIFDTGASSVNISMAEALFLLKNGHIQESDIKGTSRAQIANGEIVENTKNLLHKIEIGGIEIYDIDATVSHNLNAPLLLGQSAISKLGTIQLEGTNLIVKDAKGIEGQNDNILKLFRLGLVVLIIAVIGYLIIMIFSQFKEKNNNLESTSPKRSIYFGISSILVWFKNRKYIIYITYCILLLLSIVTIELHISNKWDKLYSDLNGKIHKTFDGINKSIDALAYDRIGELEYEEVSIPQLKTDEKDTKRINKKQWNNMFSGIKHVYKINRAWSMAGMQYAFIPGNDRRVKAGVQDYYFFPYMICVPDGLDLNSEIAKSIIEESLDKVYCEPNQYDNARNILSITNEYFHIVGNSFLQDSLPEYYMHFYDKKTGTDPIYDNNKFTGYYWFGMQKIGQYRVIFAYKNSFSWRIEEKYGFNASTKDRVVFYGIVVVLFTSLLFLFLYCVKHTNRD